MERHGLQVEMHLPLPPSGDSVEPQALAALWQHVEGCKPLCVVMSPEHSRLLDLAVDIAATHMRNARHFVCITPTNSPLCHAGCTKALRSIQGVYTAIADGCTFGCRCAVTEHLVAAGWQFVTTLPRLAMRMQRRCAGVHIHVQQAFSQRMPARMRRAIATSIRQTRDRLETAQFVAGVDDMSGEEESADVLGRPHSSVQTSFRRLHVNLGHPKKNVLVRHLRHAHATPQALEAARNFKCPACEAAKHPRVARQSSPCEVQLSSKLLPWM